MGYIDLTGYYSTSFIKYISQYRELTLLPENPINSSSLITRAGSNEIIWNKTHTCITLHTTCVVRYATILSLCKQTAQMDMSYDVFKRLP